MITDAKSFGEALRKRRRELGYTQAFLSEFSVSFISDLENGKSTAELGKAIFLANLLRLWDLLVFNWLLGNTDAHVKNFSLLYSPDLRRVRLAPAYDLVSTTADRQSTREMAFFIGGAQLLDDVTEDAFRQAARDAGLGERMAMRRFDEMCRRFKPALHESAKELISAGYDKAAELETRILQSGGIAKLG